MPKISDEELKELFKEVEEGKRKGKSLSEVFSSFSGRHGRAKGSIRNIYYSSVKKANGDEGYKTKVLGDREITVSKVIGFEEVEADALLKRVLTGITYGKSVRKVIGEMASDEKTALRYQNKYRNLLRGDKERVKKMVREVKRELGECKNPLEERKKDEEIFFNLKREINLLCDRIGNGLKEENEVLKGKIKVIEDENRTLKERLRVLSGKTEVESYFKNVSAKKPSENA